MVLLPILALVASLAPAQGHPCDAVLPVNPTITPPVVAGFCHDQLVVNARLFIDKALVWTGPASRLTGANAEGLYYFELNGVPAIKGPHVASIEVYTADGTAPLSDSYAFTAAAVPPGQAKKVRVRGGG